MPFALGQRILLRHAFHGHIVWLVALVAIVLVARFWPTIVAWIEERRS